jgi:glycine betaine catabolism B
MNVTLIRTSQHNETIKTFYFKPDQPLRYIAGQFVELTITHSQPDTRGEKRWFTLSSSPTEKLIAITTRIVPTSSTYKKALNKLPAGSVVHMSEAMGDFVLPKNTSIPLVFIAGGIGITPFRSMAKWLIDTNDQRKIQLLYSVRDTEDILFKMTFNQPNITLIPHIADELLTVDKIIDYTNGLAGKHFYIAGPEHMTESLVSQLIKRDVSKYHIVTDYFPGYVQI